MCGIGGILRVWPAGTSPPEPHVSIPEAWLDTIDEGIKHRGPDGQGRFRDRTVRADGSVVDVALVHRRLAIIDLGCGHQPMVSERGRSEAEGLVAVVFNGCIYNHRELRKELEGKGHRFVTDHSDTEVLVHGWREWGRGVFQRCDGMYGLAIWDRDTGGLTLARDCFGEKPLYFSVSRAAKITTFASTHIPLRDLAPRIGLDAKVTSAGPWARFGWNQMPPNGAIGEVYPGYSRTDPRAVEDEASYHGYWGTVLDPQHRPLTIEEADRTLARAVHTRLEADVPLGAFLSGGIDSALVCHYARQVNPGLTAFTVRMPHLEYDESEEAAETARTLGIRHEILDCAVSPATDLVSAITQLDLPFGDSSLLPSLWVSRAARQRVKVVLSGDGGDEMFMGYDRHRVLRTLNRLARVPASLRETALDVIEPGGNPKSGRSRLHRLLSASQGDGYKELVAIFPTPDDQLAGIDAGMHWGMTPSSPWPRSLDWARRFDLLFYLPCDLMRKTDTASMSVGLEVRAPFLARSVAEMCINASYESLMPCGRRKGLLRAVARRHLPAEIVDRPKQGFAIPIGEWFRSDYGGMKTLLMDHLEAAEPWPGIEVEINRGFVRQMMDEHMARQRDHSQRLYMLLVLAIWARGLGKKASRQ